jgi:hypothetical protein
MVKLVRTSKIIINLENKRSYWQEKYLKVTEKCKKEGIKPQNRGNIKNQTRDKK